MSRNSPGRCSSDRDGREGVVIGPEASCSTAEEGREARKGNEKDGDRCLGYKNR